MQFRISQILRRSLAGLESNYPIHQPAPNTDLELEAAGGGGEKERDVAQERDIQEREREKENCVRVSAFLSSLDNRQRHQGSESPQN